MEFSPKRNKKEVAAEAQRKIQRRAEVLNFVGYACGFASWAWTVLAPNSSAIFGSLLLFIALVFAFLGVLRMRDFSRTAAVFLALFVLGVFAVFDWRIVIQPQRGKEFRVMLTDGYHLESQCGSMPARSETPSWLRDASTAWQARVGQAIEQKLDIGQLKLWQSAGVLGFVKDANMSAYQCTYLATKISVLEDIVAADFDPSLPDEPYTGPIYWLNAVNGNADVSEALKKGGGKANIYIDSGTPNQDPKPPQ